jgi:hypothetical protein
MSLASALPRHLPRAWRSRATERPDAPASPAGESRGGRLASSTPTQLQRTAKLCTPAATCASPAPGATVSMCSSASSGLVNPKTSKPSRPRIRPSDFVIISSSSTTKIVPISRSNVVTELHLVCDLHPGKTSLRMAVLSRLHFTTKDLQPIRQARPYRLQLRFQTSRLNRPQKFAVNVYLILNIFSNLICTSLRRTIALKWNP